MARVEFKLPDIGEGVTEGEIVEWLVRPGDRIREDDPMVEVLTDKATVTIGAPCDARVERLHFDVGRVAQVGQTIVTLDSEGSASAGSTRPSSRPAASAVGDIRDELPGARLFGRAADRGDAPSAPKTLATPATRRLARELGVDIREIPPTGEGGRVTSDDVRAALGRTQIEGDSMDGLETRQPILGVRRKIAERMHRAKAMAAHFTFVEECDVGPLVDLRQSLAAEAEHHGARLTYLPFIVRAVTEALRRHPMLNAAVDEQRQEIVFKKYYNIGVATATEAGLLVPVVHGADRLGLFELARRIELLAQSARQGMLAPEDLRGSTFTVTSLGKRGGLLATPILNHPEVGILGVHRIKEQPVVRDGEIVGGKVMLLSLSFDHRVVDGHVGAAFAYDVIESLEDPERLLTESV
jgi:pyruvate dehydrogenase E2 component (dihydrolipoamide acetyltransferase)